MDHVEISHTRVKEWIVCLSYNHTEDLQELFNRNPRAEDRRAHPPAETHPTNRSAQIRGNCQKTDFEIGTAARRHARRTDWRKTQPDG